MTPNNTNWVVLGPGAIGGLIAGGLLEHGHNVSVLPRHSTQSELSWRVIDSSTTSYYQAPALQLPLTANSVFVAVVKAFDVTDALQHITKLDGFRRTMPIVLSHNGMVTLPEHLKELNLHHMVTTHGAVKSHTESGEVSIEHRGVGRSWLETKKQPEESAHWPILQQAFPPLSLEKDLTEKRWLKLIINCVINPLTAIHQCVNGELLKDKWQPQIYSLVGEAVAVANSQNVSLSNDECYREVISVARETALNHSSMLQDVKQQRRTEILQLTGYLINASKAVGIATPTHQALLDEFQKRYTF